LTKYIKGVYYKIAKRWSFGFVLYIALAMIPTAVGMKAKAFISPLRIGQIEFVPWRYPSPDLSGDWKGGRMAYVPAGVKLQTEHIKWLDKYRAIPYGGLAMSMMGTFVLALVIICFLLFPAGAAIALSIGLMVTVLSISINTGWISEIEKYWEKNVRGYYACFYRHEGNIVITTAEHGHPQLDLVEEECKATVGVFIPLGGWSVQAYVKYLDKKLYIRVRERPEGYRFNIFVRDCQGQGIWLDVNSSLQILEDKTRYAGNIFCPWDSYIQHLFDSRRLIDASREDVWKKHSSLLSLIKETIVRIDATKRFIKSKQAREIREWLLNEALSSLPKDRPELLAMFESLRHKEEAVAKTK